MSASVLLDCRVALEREGSGTTDVETKAGLRAADDDADADTVAEATAHNGSRRRSDKCRRLDFICSFYETCRLL